MELKQKNIKIYILSGRAGSGKDTLANMIIDKCKNYNKKAVKIAYANPLKEYAKNILDWDGSEEDKPRTFLQHLGVDLIKEKIDDNMLIRRVLEDIEVYSYFFDVIIISDARFIEEISKVKDKYKNVSIIHVIGLDNNLTEKEKTHITETSLNNYENYDYEIINKDIKIVEQKIENIVKEGIYE